MDPLSPRSCQLHTCSNKLHKYVMQKYCCIVKNVPQKLDETGKKKSNLKLQ